MSHPLIDFSKIPPATTPFEANDEDHFRARATIAISYGANQSFPGDWWGGEISGDGSVNNAIARLEMGGLSKADIHRGPVLPSGLFKDLGTDFGVLVDNVKIVNDALLRTRVRSHTGTSFEPLRTGEWDTALKGLVLILYRFRRKLRPEVYSHVLHALLNTRGARPANADIVELDFLPNPYETENHVLLIETSRYLTNQLLTLDQWQRGVWMDLVALRQQVEAELPSGISGRFREQLREAIVQTRNYDNESNGMNRWMLEHLRRFLQYDFWEYNSKPYQHYSMAALQNLFDFAWDEHVKQGARMVLDYVSAKTAVSSNGLRRSVPFRRLLEHLGDTRLFGESCDTQTVRFIMLSGLTTRLADVGFQVEWDSRDQLLLAALTKYRAPELILDIIMDKGHNEYYQQFHHGDRYPIPISPEVERDLARTGFSLTTIPGGIEIYASSKELLLSAGGVWLRSGNLDYDEFVGYKHNGNALPTTLMPTHFGADRSDFIRIDGAKRDRDRINTGVLPGFACGLNVFIPPTFFLQKVPLHPTISDMAHAIPVNAGIVREGHWILIDASPSSQNWHNNLNLYVAVYIQPCETIECFLAFGRIALSKPYFNAENFGFYEAVSSDRMGFDEFVQTVLRKNRHRTFTSEGDNEYEAIDGRLILFTPNVSGDEYRWGIKGVNGRLFDTNIHNWPLVRGDIMNSDPNSDGHNGYVTVDNPYLRERLVLDMRDPQIPRRYQFRTDAPRHRAGALVSRDIYRLDVFWVKPDGSISSTYWDRYINNGTWGLPVPLTHPDLARLNSPVVAVARTSENLDLFWIGPDNKICTSWRAVGANCGEWNLPFNVPNIEGDDLASATSGLAVVSRVPEQLDLFWIGADGSVRSHFWSSAFRDGEWERHSAFPITPPNAARTYSQVSAIGRAPGHLDVFWIGPDGAVYSHWWDEKAADGKWDQHSQFMIAPPGSARIDSAITCVAKWAEHMDVFWLGPDGAIWSNWWDEIAPDGRWDQHGPFRVTPEESVGPWSGLAAVARVPQHIDLFWITARGAIASSFWDDNASLRRWSEPFEVTLSGGAQSHSPIYTVAREPEHLDLFWIGNDNALWSHWWDSRAVGGSWAQHQPFAVTIPDSVHRPH